MLHILKTHKFALSAIKQSCRVNNSISRYSIACRLQEFNIFKGNNPVDKNWDVKKPLLSKTVSLNYLQKYTYATIKDDDDMTVDQIEEETTSDFIHTHLPAAIAIPDIWPHLPVIATKRNPVFPRFMKILEVSILNLLQYFFVVCLDDATIIFIGS